MAVLCENVRLGIVPYINAQPLIAHLSSTVDGIEIIAATPRRLVSQLRHGAVDVALLPVFALLSHPEIAMVPGVGIAADGPVESVLVVSASPREEIRRLCLDPASMTSAALVQVLFRHHWNQEVEFVERSKVSMRQEPGTAFLVIGDPALRVRRHFRCVLDLGEAWREWCGLPFVFAVWSVRPGIEIGPLAARLAQAPENFSDALFQQIAQEHHAEIGLEVEEAVTYLRDRLRYRLGRDEMLGLRQFFNACQGLGLGPSQRAPLKILPRHTAQSDTG